MKFLAWYFAESSKLTFFNPVLKQIPSNLIDIIFNNPLTDVDINIIKKEGFTGYNFISGIDKLSEYENIVCDQWYPRYDDLFLSKLNPKSNLICLVHAVDGRAHSVPRAQCVIRAHQNMSLAQDTFLLMGKRLEENSPQIYQFNPMCKEEFAYTGPYHIGDWLEMRHLPKSVLRNELENDLGQKLSKDKPVVAVFLDEGSLSGQLAIGMNKLAKHVTVIYKTISFQDPVLAKLSKQVIVWKESAYAQNSLRFGADFIMAGYYSGTFASSVMLSLPVLPFYSRLFSFNGRQDKEYSYYKNIIPTSLPAVGMFSQSLLYHYKYLFDLLQTKKILDAIYKSEFLDWYKDNLSFLQKECFGDYMLEGSPAKTAEYILNFAKYKTLGDDCYAIRLRPEYFAKK